MNGRRVSPEDVAGLPEVGSFRLVFREDDDHLAVTCAEFVGFGGDDETVPWLAKARVLSIAADFCYQEANALVLEQAPEVVTCRRPRRVRRGA